MQLKEQDSTAVSLYILCAYLENVMDLIDTISKKHPNILKHNLKQKSNLLLKAIESNDLHNQLIDGLFEIDSLGFNQYRDEVEKTIKSVLKTDPNLFSKLPLVRKTIENTDPVLFCNEDMTDFAIKFKSSNSSNVRGFLAKYIETLFDDSTEKVA